MDNSNWLSAGEKRQSYWMYMNVPKVGFLFCRKSWLF